MRTLFIQPFNDYTGSTRVLANIILQRYSLEDIAVICYGQKGFLSDIEGLKLYRFNYPRFLGRRIPIVSGLLQKLHMYLLVFLYLPFFDELYINTIVPVITAYIGILYRKPVTIHVHEKKLKLSFVASIRERLFVKVRAKKIFVSNYLSSYYPSVKNPIIEYNRLPKQFVSGVEVTPLQNRGLNKIIMLSSLQEEKGCSNYIKLAKLNPDFTFMFVCSATQAQIDDYFHNYEMPKNVVIYDRQSNIHPFLKQADLLLNMSNKDFIIETFGMTIIEGMAYGLPAIAPDAGGPLEIIEQGETGYCCDVRNLQEVSKYIKIILKGDYGRYMNNCLNHVKVFME